MDNRAGDTALMSYGSGDIHHGTTVLADGWEDHRGDPLAERLGFALVAAHDECVEARLVDAVELLDTTRGLNWIQALFISVQRQQRLGHMGEAENSTHVLGDEPRLALDSHGAKVEGGGEVTIGE